MYASAVVATMAVPRQASTLISNVTKPGSAASSAALTSPEVDTCTHSTAVVTATSALTSPTTADAFIAPSHADRDPGRPGSDLLGMPASVDDVGQATPGFATELAQAQYRRADALTVRVAGVTYAQSSNICQLAGDVRCHAFFTWITIEVSCLMTGIFSLTDVIRARASVMGRLARGGRHRVRRWLVRSTQAELGLWPRTTKVCRPSPCCA